MFNDPRNTALAKVFVEHSLKVKRGDKVVISTSDLDCEDIVRECMKLILKKGAFLYLDIMGWNWLLDRSSKGDLVRLFYEFGNEEHMKNPPTIFKNIVDWGDKFIRITTHDNYTHSMGISSKKRALRASSREKWFHEMINKKWVLTYYPTPALAQQSGMSFSQFTNFYFTSCLIDYKKMEKEGNRVMRLLDKGKVVRIVGLKTDLSIPIEGRLAANAAGSRNVPDGEVFIAPLHKKVEGEVYFDLPNFKDGVDVVGALLKFKNGKAIEATAEQGQDVLLSNLNQDEGARYIGELGIGLNYGVTQPMRTTLFDEKIGGSIHLAMGRAYEEERGGVTKGGNVSAIHWDMVKDMRKKGSKIFIDNKLVFENGKWL